MAQKIKVVMCPADRAPYVTNISNTLEAFQTAVGGYIETVDFASPVVIVCNEEGRLQGLPACRSIMMTGFVGDCFFVGTEGDEFTDLTDDQARFLLQNCKRVWKKLSGGIKQ